MPDARYWISRMRAFIQHRVSVPGAFASNSTSAIIATPDESSDQFVVRVFCPGGTAHGARDPDATPKERRLGSRIRWGSDGKHFRRTDDERACEVHDLVSRHFLRAYIWVVCFVRTSRYWRGERVPTRAHETTSSSRNFSRLVHSSTFTRFFSSEFADSGFSCLFSGARGATNSDAIRPAFR
jgi:hypothetical protein